MSCDYRPIFNCSLLLLSSRTFCFLLFLKVYLFARERVCVREVGRGRGREHLKQNPAEHGAPCISGSHHPEILTGAETKSQVPHGASQGPPTPLRNFRKCLPDTLIGICVARVSPNL